MTIARRIASRAENRRAVMSEPHRYESCLPGRLGLRLDRILSEIGTMPSGIALILARARRLDASRTRARGPPSGAVRGTTGSPACRYFRCLWETPRAALARG